MELSGASLKSQTMQTRVYQAGKSDLGAEGNEGNEGNEVALKGLHKGTPKSHRYFQLTDTPSSHSQHSVFLFSCSIFLHCIYHHLTYYSIFWLSVSSARM